MPYGIFPVPQLHAAPGGPPGVMLRLRTWWQRPALDERIANGDDPAMSDELALRAAQLRAPAVRRELANMLVRAVGDARAPNLEPHTARGRRRRAEVLEWADDLLSLAAQLRGTQPIDVRGTALAARALAERDLGDAVRAARLALDPPPSTAQDLRPAA